MKHKTILSLLVAGALFATACNTAEQETSTAPASTASAKVGGQSAVQDDDSQKDVVKVAVGSPDHTTLVKAIQGAGYVDALSNAGPFTVFAPTNAAFDKLPAGTLDDLMKPANQNKLRDILEYHVSLGVYNVESLTDGRSLGQANGQNVTFAKNGEQTTINGANIVASIPASNGVIHVIDAVLLPPAQ